jgi:sortase A
VKILLKIPRRSITVIERGLLLTGAAVLAVFAAAHAHRAIMVRAELERFKESSRPVEAAQITTANPTIGPAAGLPGDGSKDACQTRSPSSGCPTAPEVQRSGLLRYVDLPLAVLRIPKLRLEVPVLNGTDELTLNRGVGRIPGTALIGQTGNIGIAGHRDGFFSGLKDIHSGDSIELLSANGTDVYIVDRTLVTGPDDLSVLESGAKPTLTLVTCYPFHYIGPAPRRFIVEASLKERNQ